MKFILRRIVAPLLLLLLTFAVLELGSFVAYRIVEGQRFSYAEFETRRSEIIRAYQVAREDGDAVSALAKSSDRGPEALQVLHPFLAYVRNPEAPMAQRRPNGPVNAYGWRGDGDPFHTADDEATIVIVGGSVAFKNWSSRKILIEKIQTLPQFEDKKIYYETLALEGYKQPSQLISVVYYLALGGKIDILINLDGQNEVQYMKGTNYFPVYPRRWIALTRELGSPETLEIFGRAHVLKDLRLRVCQLADHARRSVTASVFWHFLDRMMRTELDRLSIAAEGLVEADEARGKEHSAALPFARGGPAFEGDVDERVRYAVDVWSNSSIALAQLAEGLGFYYFHFLQPSQYLSESKPFSDEERERFILPDAGKRIPFWYPRMLEHGAVLRERGVAFFDLTEVFKQTPETTYSDWCCHLNQRGKDLVAERIGEVIVESIANAPSTRSFKRWPSL